MIEQLLEARLRPVWQRRWWLDLGWRLASCWAGAAVISAAVLLLSRALRLTSPLTLPILALVTLAATAFVIARHRRRRPDLLRIARELESRDAQLDGRLTTALEQRPGSEGSLNFLQHRLIVEAVETSFRQKWPQEISWARLAGAGVTSVAALILWLVILATLYVPRPAGTSGLVVRVADLEVTPGDVEVERGNTLVVLARFGGSVPPDARMIVTPRTGTPQTIPLTRSLGDPVFGGTLPEVTDDFKYRVEAGSRKSEEFTVKVFEFPRLQRADADLEYPPYTRLANKRIDDTRRVSAVEGTTLDLGLQLNKPVVSARLKPRGTTNGVLELSGSPSQASVALTNFVLVQSGTYDLELIDSDGRTNKTPAQFVFDVVVNRTPELKFIQPRGDQRPSALEELTFEGSVWDDFGVLAYGFAYANGPGEAVVVTLGTNAPAQEKRSFRHPLSLETLSVAPDDLISWYLWADDLGPDGQIRRTQSDLFFGEVRPFDEIFRENQSGGGGGGGGGEQDGSPTSKLAELQKKILNATWKLERERVRAKPTSHAQDIEVVRDSQSDALDQAKEQSSGAADPRAEVMWGSVLTSMEKALTQLVAATNKISLQASLSAETAAYQALLKLREREFQVSRNQRQQGGGGGGGEQQRQRQLSELDFTDEANRYETQREAQTPQSADRQEQLQVLSRLSELARRQEDLNERLKELQAQLQEADTEKEREEIRRQLKRLQEEQQEMLADADELQQRMDRPENQSRFAEQRKQLEQTRDELQKASEAASQGATSQALASGTRAQEQLQQMREQVQQESSSQFAEDLRQMRQEARDLTRQQEQIGQELDALQNEQKRSLSNSAQREGLVKQLESQQSRLTNLLADVTQVSQAAEASEPIVSRQLYDTLRQMNQADAGLVKQLQEDLINRGQMTRSLYDRLEESQEAGEGRALSVLQDLVQEGLLPQAEAVDEKARKTLAQLQRGVEKAAESVLGDDTQALQRAQQELAELTSQLERELAQAGGPGAQPGTAPGGQPGLTNAPAGRGTSPSDPPTPGSPGSPGAPQTAQTSPTPGSPGSPSDGAPGQTPGQTPGQSPGQGPGQTPGRGQGGQPGQGQQPGSSGSPSETAQAGRSPSQRGQRGQSGQTGGGGTGPGEFDLSALESMAGNNTGGGGGGRGGSGVLTSEEYGPWTDRLREVEDMIDDPGLRSQVANARERARLARQEVRRDLKKPDWAVVRLQVLQPLVEVQQQIREELRRRDPGESLVPIDRDPVPSRYAELVRRYYEQLGKE